MIVHATSCHIILTACNTIGVLKFLNANNYVVDTFTKYAACQRPSGPLLFNKLDLT